MSSSTRRVAVGLPSNPRSRQPSPPSSNGPQYEDPRPSRTISTPWPRNPPSQRTQVLDTSQSRRRENYDRGRYVRRSNDSSSTSSSETGPYVRNRGVSSQRSSKTSANSNDEMTHSVRDQYEDNNAYSYAATTNGYVWTRVAEVANVLTQEVSKVWAAGLGSGDDEEGESHLLEVMRAYHLAKARTPSELPEWLFSERERGQGGLLRVDPPSTEEREKPALGRQRLPHNTLKSSPLQSRNVKSYGPLGQPKLSSADRLKQLRSLRREQGA